MRTLKNIDESIIGSLRALESPQDLMPFLDEMIRLFIIDGRISAQKLRGAFASQDFPDVERWAHKLKGQSRNLGAVRVSEVCAIIEHAALKDPGSVSAALVQSAEAELEEAISSLRRFLRSA